MEEQKAQLEDDAAKSKAEWESKRLDRDDEKRETREKLKAEKAQSYGQGEVEGPVSQAETPAGHSWFEPANTIALAADPAWMNSCDVMAAGQSNSALSWDRWYERVAKLARSPLLEALARHGNPSGTNTILITVWKNHHLVAQVVTPGNAEFDRAAIEAYSSLDGNPALEFPLGSCRPVVFYFTDHSHSTSGVPIDVPSKEIKGDIEYLHCAW